MKVARLPGHHVRTPGHPATRSPGNHFPQTPAENAHEIMRMKFAENREPPRTAENAAISRWFSTGLRTGRKGDDCYTSQAFASDRDEIHTTYYDYY